MPGVMEDRELWVGPDEKVRSDWVHIDDCKLGSRERMDVGRIESAYRRLLQMGGCQSWPPVLGHWEGDRFVVMDGRHEYLAALALGREGLFVAWRVAAEPAAPDSDRCTVARALGAEVVRERQGREA